MMGVEYTFVSDASDQFDTPSDGDYRMYDGGTTIDQVKGALDAKATISLQYWNTPQDDGLRRRAGARRPATFHYPLGVRATDSLLMKVSELSGKAIPEAIRMERGRLVDAMADSQAYLHGKKYAIWGDPDFVQAMAQFIMETGGEPTHCLATNGSKAWEAEMKEMLAANPFGANAQVWAGKDLWHLRSLLFTEPVDFMIGSSYGKYLERDTGVPLIRLTFPIFDRHHHHRFPIMGYQGGLRVLDDDPRQGLRQARTARPSSPARPTTPTTSPAEIVDVEKPTCRTTDGHPLGVAVSLGRDCASRPSPPDIPTPARGGERP